MLFHIVKNINSQNCHKFVNMLYQNFIDLVRYPNLLHNKIELNRLVTSQKVHIYVIMINNKIVAYLVGEIKQLNDNRTVFYISYLFTAKKFRKQGYGNSLIEYVTKISTASKYDGILLTCDTEDRRAHHFYMARGFMPDMLLRTYQKHDVLFRRC